jgi:hypothetical protein
MSPRSKNVIRDSRPQPTPAGQTPYARRLEHIRLEVAGGISLKDFHQRLTSEPTEEGDPYEVSYSAVRNYHYDSREPPVSYLTQVAHVYGVRVAYLWRGEEPVTAVEERVSRLVESRTLADASATAEEGEYAHWADEIDRRFGMAFPGAGRGMWGNAVLSRGEYVYGPGHAAHALLWRLWKKIVWIREVAAFGISATEYSTDSALEAADIVIRAVLAPLRELDAASSWGPSMQHKFDSPLAQHANMTGDHLDSYIITTCETLLQSVAKRQAEVLSQTLPDDEEGLGGEPTIEESAPKK